MAWSFSFVNSSPLPLSLGLVSHVSNSRIVGKSTKGTIMVEVACADGLKGYIIEYNTSPVTAVASTGCAFAGGCKLPGNT